MEPGGEVTKPATGTNRPGTIATCDGCGSPFERHTTGQRYCTSRCYRLTSGWAYGAVFDPTHRKAPEWDGSESR